MIAPKVTMPARRWHGNSSRRLLDAVVLSPLSQRHSTAVPSPKRYGKRYEVEGRTNFLERRTGEVRRTRLSRRWTTVCASTGMYGKCVALQREIGRSCAAGALRADSLRSKCHPRVRMLIRRPNILWLPVRRLRLIPNYPKGRAARLWRDPHTDFRESPCHEIG
jgi:hypothetical protein